MCNPFFAKVANCAIFQKTEEKKTTCDTPVCLARLMSSHLIEPIAFKKKKKGKYYLLS